MRDEVGPAFQNAPPAAPAGVELDQWPFRAVVSAVIPGPCIADGTRRPPATFHYPTTPTVFSVALSTNALRLKVLIVPEIACSVVSMNAQVNALVPLGCPLNLAVAADFPRMAEPMAPSIAAARCRNRPNT